MGNCHGSQTPETVLHILFIGNSYTSVNDLPGTFAKLACSGGHQIETDIAAVGGWTLADHANSAQTIAKLNQQKWDMVILQEQSEFPTIPYDRAQYMYPAVRWLVAKIRDLGAQPYLLITWGHRDGLPDAGIPSYTDMQAQLDAGYMGIANELGVAVVPVGDAWLQARKQSNPLDLWQDDGSHPNEQGTYLAASVFYATIFHQSPVGLSFRAGLSQKTAQSLQTLAADTVQVK